MDFRYCPGICVGSEENREHLQLLSHRKVSSGPERTGSHPGLQSVRCRPSAGYDGLLPTRSINLMNLERTLPLSLVPAYPHPLPKLIWNHGQYFKLYQVGSTRSFCQGHTAAGENSAITKSHRCHLFCSMSPSLSLLPLPSPPLVSPHSHPICLRPIFPITIFTGRSLCSKTYNNFL